MISILSCAIDHTWAAVKNYSKKDIDNAQTMFTITTENGEIACAVIVGSTSASQFSHALGQFLNRKGCTPKMYVTDNWPTNKVFFEFLYHKHTSFRLGLFLSIKRITSTMRKENCTLWSAVKALLSCLYYENEKDVERV